MDSPPPPPPPPPTSTLLNDLAEAFPGESVSVGELLERLDSRANGVVLLVVALPMCIPNIPGISTIFGALMLAPAAQLILGSRTMWTPKRVRAWRVDCNALRRTFKIAAPALARIEYLIKPRLAFLTRPPFTIYIGLQTLFLALVLILPIPGGNWPPGITVALTALALLQRDGLLMLVTIAACAVSTYAAFVFGSFFLYAVVGWIGDLAAWLGPLFGG